MSKARITILVILLTLLGLWWAVIHVPSVEQAFWDFCTLGILPWSGKPIAREALWRSLIGIFTISFMLIFRKEIMESLPHRRAASTPRQLSKLGDSKVESPQNIPQLRLRRDVVLTINQTQTTQKSNRNVLRPLLLVAGKICIWMVSIGDTLERVFRRAAQILAAAIKRVAHVLFLVVWQIILVAATITLSFWQYIKPHIHKFDRWLNVRLHRNATTASMLRTSNDFWKAATDTYKKLQSSQKAPQSKIKS
jgi:hypothetical protein